MAGPMELPGTPCSARALSAWRRFAIADRLTCSRTSRLPAPRRSDEQRDRRPIHLKEGGRGADRLLEAVEEVVLLEAEEIHRHLARDQAHAHLLGRLQKSRRVRRLVVLRELAHHVRPGAGEVELRELGLRW